MNAPPNWNVGGAPPAPGPPPLTPWPPPRRLEPANHRPALWATLCIGALAVAVLGGYLLGSRDRPAARVTTPPPASTTSPPPSPTPSWTPYRVPQKSWDALPSPKPSTDAERTLWNSPLNRQEVPASASCPKVPSSIDSRARYRSIAHQVLDCQYEAWSKVFDRMGRHLAKPKLVIFSGSRTSRCGTVPDDQSVYCPTERTIYLNEKRFDSSKEWWRLHFADTVVHEFIHHVQSQADLLTSAYDLRMDSDERTRRVELQAYCLTNRVMLITPSFAFGAHDYAIVKEWTADRRSGTHGSPDSRQYWWTRGFQAERVGECNTWVVPPARVT